MPSADVERLQLSFSTEIKHMMYGFGDSPSPLKESVELVERIVRQQLGHIVNLATECAVYRNSKALGLEDFLFLLRHNHVKLRRFCKYLAVLDLKRSMAKTSTSSKEDPDLELVGLSSAISESKRLQSCLSFLKNLDPSGLLARVADPHSECPSLEEQIKERESRIEKMTNEMDVHQYLEFSRIRQSSFSKKNTSTKFREWLQDGIELPDIKIGSLSWEILSYMAYETVAQIVDLCLLVRRDMLAGHLVDDVQRNIAPRSLVQNSSLSQFTWSTVVKPIQVAEIQEAMLRFSSQNSAVSPFTRNYCLPERTRVLAL